MEKIEATVSGRVLAILVKVGDKVAVGDDVAKIESMKMEIPVSSDFEGTVSNIAITVDEQVEEGQPIIELDD
ncbi:acetyl-CoA carboxylase biotin carboxyl carrier protein subunit [Pusillimonas sp. ANT_WB101]|uniref:acetyl-CoA carboxylase biotin carboxyl carrier protein subunit n=1 Tax=Pusillimonas sp. ANT_WB101 TaxID=2597356 RepID=UPI0011EDA7B5|nr:acetyl-CoA carboxylase biotin carboxyl carrier protein subunit [Pusillimonas sp. ANT_WB101]KAA0910427.1 acetyl-CoA carboxylase biotin carboxyl carrier protein subunit [Pusillimonas sp. ANT_WB101]